MATLRQRFSPIVSRLRRWAAPPVFEDEATTRGAALLNALLLATTGALVAAFHLAGCLLTMVAATWISGRRLGMAVGVLCAASIDAPANAEVRGYLRSPGRLRRLGGHREPDGDAMQRASSISLRARVQPH